MMIGEPGVQGIHGPELKPEFPVRLSAAAAREATLATGRRAFKQQVFAVPHLTLLPLETRGRAVDVLDRVEITYEQIEHEVEDQTHIEEIHEVTAYGALRHHQRQIWVLTLPQGGSVRLDTVLFPSPGRTLTLAEHLIASGQATAEEVSAVFAGTPLVTGVDEQGNLTIDAVLDAYERALEIAQLAADLAREHGTPFDLTFGGWPLVHEDDGLLLLMSPYAHATGLLRESDAKQFDEAQRTMRKAMDNLSGEDLGRLVLRICHRAQKLRESEETTDPDIVTYAIQIESDLVSEEVQHQQDAAAAETAYAKAAREWIAEHGSGRLKQAAARGYRHDGIYRDERLAQELPDFEGWLGRNPQVREVVNPSEESLRIEVDTLKRLKGLSMDLPVRIVWVVTDSSTYHGTGEYVRVENYLGKHTVYRPGKIVEPGEIPF
jgi:hypothetical protein